MFEQRVPFDPMVHFEPDLRLIPATNQEQTRVGLDLTVSIDADFGFVLTEPVPSKPAKGRGRNK